MNPLALKRTVLFYYNDGKTGNAQRRKKNPQNYTVCDVDLETCL